VLFWWNPLVWIAREELRLVHEYEADEGVVQNGIDATQYQLLLVRKAVGEQRFSLASGFQHAKLKNRITMMLKPSSSGWMRWSYLAIIPVLAACMFACNPARNTSNQDADAQDEIIDVEATVPTPEQEALPYQLIENKPTFDGGDANNFAKWVNSHLNYPEEAKKNNIEGRVTLQFTVGADGVVRDIEVLRSVNDLLDAEAVKVVSESPKWEPGTQDGKPVPVQFVFPIIFKLK
jgi:TonB family protein